MAALILPDCLEKIALPEIWPEFFNNHHLGITDLPQQEIRNSHLTRSADEEIWVGNTSGLQPRGEELAVDLRR